MLTTGGIQLLDAHYLVELVIIVCIEETEDARTGPAAARVNHHIKAAKGMAEPLGVPNGKIDGLDGGRVEGLVGRRSGEAVEAAVLIAHNEAPLVVLAHGNPRSLLVPRDRVKELDRKALRHLDLLSRGSRALSRERGQSQHVQ